MRPFQALGAATKSISVGASTSNVQLVNGEPGGVLQVRVANNGTATCWVAFGDNTIAASTTADIPIGPGVIEVLTVQAPTNAPLYAAAIAAGATGSVYFTPGAGF